LGLQVENWLDVGLVGEVLLVVAEAYEEGMDVGDL